MARAQFPPSSSLRVSVVRRVRGRIFLHGMKVPAYLYRWGGTGMGGQGRKAQSLLSSVLPSTH